MPETLIISENDLENIVDKASVVSRVFGDDAHSSFPIDYTFEFGGLYIHHLHCTDFCGVTNGHLEIKEGGEEVFKYDYGEAASLNQFSQADITSAVKTYRPGSWERELDKLYELAKKVDKKE